MDYNEVFSHCPNRPYIMDLVDTNKLFFFLWANIYCLNNIKNKPLSKNIKGIH